MQEKKAYKICLLAANLLLLGIWIGLVCGLLPMQWRETQNMAITQLQKDGSMRAATVCSYTPTPFWFHADGENVKYGETRMNGVYLQETLATISERYIRTYGFNTKLTLSEQASSAGDFCYTLSGAPNGETWEVWVVCARNEAPRVMVYTGEVTAQ